MPEMYKDEVIPRPFCLALQNFHSAVHFSFPSTQQRLSFHLRFQNTQRCSAKKQRAMSFTTKSGNLPSP